MGMFRRSTRGFPPHVIVELQTLRREPSFPDARAASLYRDAQQLGIGPQVARELASLAIYHGDPEMAGWYSMHTPLSQRDRAGLIRGALSHFRKET